MPTGHNGPPCTPFAVTQCPHSLPAPNPCLQSTPQGLRLRSQQMVGVDSPLGLLPMIKEKGTINQAIIDGYRGSLSATAAGYLNVLHFIEVRDLGPGHVMHLCLYLQTKGTLLAIACACCV